MHSIRVLHIIVINNGLYPKLHHRHKNGCCSVGTFVKFVWATMGRKILNGNISAKKEDIEL